MSKPAVNSSHPIRHRGFLSGFIFLAFKAMLLSILAWAALLTWFFAVFVLKGESIALQQAESIVLLNVHFIAQSQVFLAKLIANLFTMFHQLLLQAMNYLLLSHYAFVQTAMMLLVNVTEINISRVCIFMLALPLFAVILLVFVTDGLVKRDIRKFQGARESALTFHRMKHTLGFAFFIPFFIYLCLPLAIAPLFFLMLQGLALGIIVWLSTASFKKYV